jgi:hypothetical protein
VCLKKLAIGPGLHRKSVLYLPYIHLLQTNSFTERIYNVVKTFLRELFNDMKINPSRTMEAYSFISKFESIKPFMY